MSAPPGTLPHGSRLAQPGPGAAPGSISRVSVGFLQRWLLRTSPAPHGAPRPRLPALTSGCSGTPGLGSPSPTELWAVAGASLRSGPSFPVQLMAQTPAPITGWSLICDNVTAVLLRGQEGKVTQLGTDSSAEGPWKSPKALRASKGLTASRKTAKPFSWKA